VEKIGYNFIYEPPIIKPPIIKPPIIKPPIIKIIEKNRFISLKVNGIELQPRQQFLSTPYSLRTNFSNSANIAKTVRGNSMMIAENGNVGIGTNNPDAKLEVKGNIIASPPSDYNHVVTKGYLKKWGETGLGGFDSITCNYYNMDLYCFDSQVCPEGFYMTSICNAYDFNIGFDINLDLNNNFKLNFNHLVLECKSIGGN